INYHDLKSPHPWPEFSTFSGVLGHGRSPVGASNDNFPPLDQFGFALSPDFNKSYFNPATRYLPWKKHDGTRWEAASPSAARLDPRSGKLFIIEHEIVYDLTDPDGRKDPSDLGFKFITGMVVPKGITYRTETPDAECEGLL